MKEIYAHRPNEVEVFHHGGYTDIILRKDIQQVDDPEDGTRWECQEAQYRHEGVLVLEDVARAFGHWWGVATAASADELEQAKIAKLEELSAICNATITAGVDVVLDDGPHHFSMKQEDQINLLSLQALLAAGAETVPYHGDGEPCRPFTAQEFAAVAEEATAVKIYHESYYNSLRTYVESLPNVYSVLGVQYGMAIPAEYQSEVFLRFLNGETFAVAPVSEDVTPDDSTEDIQEDSSESMADTPDLDEPDISEDQPQEPEAESEPDTEPEQEDEPEAVQDDDSAADEPDEPQDGEGQEQESTSEEPDSDPTDESDEPDMEQDDLTDSVPDSDFPLDEPDKDDDEESPTVTEDDISEMENGEETDETNDEASGSIPDWSNPVF